MPPSDIEDPSILIDGAMYFDEPEEQRYTGSTFKKFGDDTHDITSTAALSVAIVPQGEHRHYPASSTEHGCALRTFQRSSRAPSAQSSRSLTRSAFKETVKDSTTDFSPKLKKALGPLNIAPDTLQTPKGGSASTHSLTGVNPLVTSNARAYAHGLLAGYTQTLGAHAVDGALPRPATYACQSPFIPRPFNSVAQCEVKAEDPKTLKSLPLTFSYLKCA